MKIHCMHLLLAATLCVPPPCSATLAQADPETLSGHRLTGTFCKLRVCRPQQHHPGRQAHRITSWGLSPKNVLLTLRESRQAAKRGVLACRPGAFQGPSDRRANVPAKGGGGLGRKQHLAIEAIGGDEFQLRVRGRGRPNECQRHNKGKERARQHQQAIQKNPLLARLNSQA